MKHFVVLIGFLLISKIGISCLCFPYQPDFYKNVTKETYNCIAVFDTMNYDYEYEGVNEQTAYFILLDTINSIGSVIGDTIVVTGQDGFNCGEWFNGFAKGDTIALALYKGFYKIFERDTFYLEGVCGKFYLEIKNGQNEGLTIPEIKKKIEDVMLTAELNSAKDKITIYPNPAHDKLTITSEAENVIVNSLIVSDITGRVIFNCRDHIINEYQLDISLFNPGLYNLLIITNKERINKKFCKY